jgi:glutathione S-transferase
VRLYDYWESGNGYKVRLLLAQLGLPCERVELDILKGETRTPEFLAKNPNGRIPLLELDDGRLLAESNAILWWLANGTPLPAGRRLRARAGAPVDVLRAVQPRAAQRLVHAVNRACRFAISSPLFGLPRRERPEELDVLGSSAALRGIKPLLQAAHPNLDFRNAEGGCVGGELLVAEPRHRGHQVDLPLAGVDGRQGGAPGNDPREHFRILQVDEGLAPRLERVPDSREDPKSGGEILGRGPKRASRSTVAKTSPGVRA